jgi:predicted DCC family thiol-disulfide oxidoreductase YuxK
MNNCGDDGEGPASGAPNRVRNAVLYDNDCSLCTFQIKLLGWMDWSNRIALIPLADPVVAVIAASLTPEALREAIHCVTPSGRIYRGARAIRFVGMRVPLLWPLALFLWIPGVIFIAEIVYQWISRNRYVLSRVFGCKDACAILPSRIRPEDAQSTLSEQDRVGKRQ